MPRRKPTEEQPAEPTQLRPGTPEGMTTQEMVAATEIPGVKSNTPEGPAVPTSVDDEDHSPEEYELHRFEILKRLPPEEKRPKNIYGRLSQILGLVGQIRKTGKNTFHNYRYAKEADLVEEIRPILAEYGIWIEQGLCAVPEDGIIAHQRLGQIRKKDGIVISEAETLTAITKRFRFCWWNPAGLSDAQRAQLDDLFDRMASKTIVPDAYFGMSEAVNTHPAGGLEATEWVMFMGYGDDAGDKGYYKAETGSVKYFLMKTFMVATGDDPEGDPRQDQRAAARDAEGSPRVSVQAQPRQPGRQQQSQPTPGGQQADTSKPQVKQLGELLRQAGVRGSEPAAKLIGEKIGREIKLEGEDKAAALRKAIDELKPNEIAKAIFEIRKQLQQPAASDGDDKGPQGQGAQDELASGERQAADDETEAREDTAPVNDEYKAGDAV